MKKYITLAVILIILAPVSRARSVEFLDVKEGAWYYKDVVEAVEAGLVKGHGDGRFGPGDNLHRAEMATILAQAFGLKEKVDLKKFVDVEENDWFYKVCKKSTPSVL